MQTHMASGSLALAHAGHLGATSACSAAISSASYTLIVHSVVDSPRATGLLRGTQLLLDWTGRPGPSELTDLSGADERSSGRTDTRNDGKSRIDHGRLSRDVAPASEGDPDHGAASAPGWMADLLRLRSQIHITGAGAGGRPKNTGEYGTAGCDRGPHGAYPHASAAGADPEPLAADAGAAPGWWVLRKSGGR